ncbi:hypothetical protein GGR51DRAFT_495649 [Nemania sp. FL0031]|nr:hypothetical protein GGR51DRAFT_495649 [Nemania sp. FL0031]
MSRYYPHSAYAEDQPFARTILITHVETRAITTGTIVGTGVFAAREALQKLRKIAPSDTFKASRPQLYLRAAGLGTLGAVAFVSIGLVPRMWGREDIEWQDRSWRLLENKGQVETDDWTYAGIAAGLAATVILKRPVNWVAAVGYVGAGSTAGMLGYLSWRHGVHRGKFRESE